MKFAIVVLSLLEWILACVGQDPHQRLPKRVEDQYLHIFNFKLEQIFHAPETLNEASRQTQVNAANPIYSEKSLGFGCANYHDGAEIGKSVYIFIYYRKFPLSYMINVL